MNVWTLQTIPLCLRQHRIPEAQQIYDAVTKTTTAASTGMVNAFRSFDSFYRDDRSPAGVFDRLTERQMSVTCLSCGLQQGLIV
jgi:hypothetical protein